MKSIAKLVRRLHPVHFFLTMLLLGGIVAPPTRADDSESPGDLFLIADHAQRLRLDVADLKTAILNTGEPPLQAAFSLLNHLETKAREIDAFALKALDGESDIEALAFLIMLEAAKDARDDLKVIMEAVQSSNKKKKGRERFFDSQQHEAVASATEPSDRRRPSPTI